MTYQLHIWGPAFGLPSIDPECLAATAYLKSALPRDAWVLVPAHDPSWSPNGDFPVLRDASSCIAGYRSIVKYLESQGWALNISLTKEKLADHTALASHISSNALPLLDSLLYTTPDSYQHTTRSAWSHILPRSASLVIPHHRQAAAEVRTASAGITFPSDAVGDLDTLSDPNDPQQQQQHAASMHSNSPSLLFARTRTLQATLRKEAMATRFRLDHMVCNLLDPLQHVLTARRDQHTNEESVPSELHCLAFGYLGIMLRAHVTHPWFAETTKARFPGIADFIEQMEKILFGNEEISAQIVMTQAPALNSFGSSDAAGLPWRLPSPPSYRTAVISTFSQALDYVISPAQRWLLFSQPQGHSESSMPPLPILGLAVAPPLLTGIACYVWSTIFSSSASSASYWGGGEADKHFGRPLYANKLEGLGEAGAMLSVIGGV